MMSRRRRALAAAASPAANSLIPVEDYEGGRIRTLTVARQRKARQLGATHIVTTRYELDERRLPVPLRREIQARGLVVVGRIGSTTYQNSVWAVGPAAELARAMIRTQHAEAAGPESSGRA